MVYITCLDVCHTDQYYFFIIVLYVKLLSILYSLIIYFLTLVILYIYIIIFVIKDYKNIFLKNYYYWLLIFSKSIKYQLVGVAKGVVCHGSSTS